MSGSSSSSQGNRRVSKQHRNNQNVQKFVLSAINADESDNLIAKMLKLAIIQCLQYNVELVLIVIVSPKEYFSDGILNLLGVQGLNWISEKICGWHQQILIS